MTDLERALSDRVADGRITAEDAAIALQFQDFLRQVGPFIGPRTEAQQAFRRRCYTDPIWRAFLGLDPSPDNRGKPQCRTDPLP